MKSAKARNQHHESKKKRRYGVAGTSVAAVALVGLVAGCGSGGSGGGSGSNSSNTAASANGAANNTTASTSGKKYSDTGTIVIGGKNFTEQDIMADMMKLLITHETNLNVKMKTWLDSNVVWNAMKNHNIDLYVEYTGTGLVNILKDTPMTDPQAVYNKVKKQFETKYQITWLKPIGFNNTYAMAMRSSEAKRLGIVSISDMAKQSGNLVLGTEQDFITRADTLPAMNKLYGTHFKAVKSMDIGLKYQALIDKKVDVIDAFSTDGKIPYNHLVLLKDDKHLFPPYYAAPIIQDSTLKQHPELKTILNQLAGKIDDSEMQKLNEQVDIKHKNAMTVAQNWLTQHGLLN